MLTRLRAHLTYGNVLATVAVFVALGGTSYAVATGTIGSREIKDNSVRGKDIRNDEVRTKDVRNGSLLARDFKAGQLPAGPRGDTGPPGPQGVPGPQGPVGPTFATAFANPKSPVPPADPDTDVVNGQYSHTFVTPRPGRLLAFRFAEAPRGQLLGGERLRLSLSRWRRRSGQRPVAAVHHPR
jgi:hypothetical protein